MEVKIDSMKIKEIILNFPSQFKVGAERGENVFFRKKFKRLVFSGMGGSALSPELLKIYFHYAKIKIPILIHRDYNLPFDLTNEDLIFFISYSGNTEETISAFEKSLNKELSILTISSGGKLQDLSKKYNIPHISIPSGLPPRFSLGYQLGAILKILNNSKIIFFDFNQEIKVKPKKWENIGKKIAQLLRNKIPIIYSSFINFPLALIWKIKFNENTKIPSFCNYFPELNHNEMVGFSQMAEKFFLIILADKNDKNQILKRMKLTSKILRKKNLKSFFVKILEEKPLEKIFNNILLADWASYYLSQYYKIDPGPVKMVEEFKKLLKK